MGATGAIGRALVAELLSRGQSVAALTRDAGRATGLPGGVEVRQGDFRRPQTLKRALEGVERVYMLADPDVAHTVAESLRQAGVKRIVAVVSAVLDERDARGRVRNVIEDAVRGSGAEWTILRPRAFASNAVTWWSRTIRLHRGVHWVYPQARLSPIREADVAAVAAAALTEDGHAGRTYMLTGPESLTQAEQVEIIGRAIGAEISYHEIPREQAEEVLGDHGIPAEIIRKLLDTLEAAVDTDAQVTSTVQQVTNRPARTFARWAAEHVNDFR